MWSPALPEGSEPVYRRLVAALEADVRSGALPAGARLPPQRELAHRLSLGVGTITRAYAEAEQRGLIEGQVGRGSFVAPQAAPAAAGDIDLARNLPPAGAAERRLAQALAGLARDRTVLDQLGYPSSGGAPAHRRAGARWLGQVAGLEAVDPARLIVCAGAQQAMAVALGALCAPGDAVIAESVTFAGLKTLAAHMRLRLVPAAMDAEGLTPEALDEAAAISGARAAYVLPVQNPTGRVMGLARRRAIVDVARRRGLTLVEDNLYGAYAAPLGLPPLAALAPGIVCYIDGLSKTLAPGLRVGYLLAPAATPLELLLEVLRAVAFGAPTFGAAIASRWIEDGAAFDILDEVRAETAARAAAARAILGPALEATPLTAAPHLWLPMDELAAERLVGRALRAGVRLTPPRAVTLDGAPVTGVRLCVGAPADRAELERGLAVVASALAPGAPEAGEVV